MTASRLANLLLFFCYITSQTVAEKSGRGFIGAEVENGNYVIVDQATAQALQSSLTTVFLPVMYIVVFVVGLPANIMALWVFLFRTKKKHPATIYMANLALCDLLFVIWIPLKIAYHFNRNNWIYGEGMCKVLIGFFYGNMYCSILFIACLSVQRYWVVAHPFSQLKKNNRVAILISLFIWLFIWVTTTPLYLYQQTAKIKDLEITTCHDVSIIQNQEKVFESIQYSFGYFMSMAFVAFLLPSVVIIVAYFMLLRAVGNSMTEGNAGKNRRKAVVLIVTVLTVFLVSFVPSNIMLVLHYSLLYKGLVNNGYGFYITTLCLASFNSCLDPFIYYFVSDDFRDHVKNMFLCRSNRTVERMRVSFSSMKYSSKTSKYVSDNSTTQTSSC